MLLGKVVCVICVSCFEIKNGILIYIQYVCTQKFCPPRGDVRWAQSIEQSKTIDY